MNMSQFSCAPNRTSTQTTSQQQKQLPTRQPAKQKHNAPPKKNKAPLSLPHATFAHSATALLKAFTYSVVTLAAMLDGVVKNNPHLIYIAIGLAAAHMPPNILKTLLGLLKSNLPL